MEKKDKTPRIDELEGLVELDDRLDLTFDPVTGLIASVGVAETNSHNMMCCNDGC
jgi:hypothetical protein